MAKPFEDTALYESWRDAKLANFSTRLDNYLVEIKNPLKLSSTEFEKIRKTCDESSFCLIKIKEQSDYASVINKINSQLGLIDYDKHLYVKTNGLASITVSKKQINQNLFPTLIGSLVGILMDITMRKKIEFVLSPFSVSTHHFLVVRPLGLTMSSFILSFMKNLETSLRLCVIPKQ